MPACSSPATTALIAANASTGSFFYKDTVIGDPVITVAATGFTSIQQTEAFTSLRFNSAAFSVQTNACSSAISLQSADAQTGSPTSLTQPTTISPEQLVGDRQVLQRCGLHDADHNYPDLPRN